MGKGNYEIREIREKEPSTFAYFAYFVVKSNFR